MAGKSSKNWHFSGKIVELKENSPPSHACGWALSLLERTKCSRPRVMLHPFECRSPIPKHFKSRACPFASRHFKTLHTDSHCVCRKLQFGWYTPIYGWTKWDTYLILLNQTLIFFSWEFSFGAEERLPRKSSANFRPLVSVHLHRRNAPCLLSAYIYILHCITYHHIMYIGVMYPLIGVMYHRIGSYWIISAHITAPYLPGL